MILTTRRAFTFFIIMMLFTVNTSFIFCCYIENSVAEDITHSEYTSVLTVGTGDPKPTTPISSLNNSPITKTISDDEDNIVSDTIRVTITKNKSVHRLHFNFLQRFIDRFARLALLFYLLSQKSTEEEN